MTTIASYISNIDAVKQAIKTSITNKGVSMTGVTFTGYAGKIDEISGSTENTYTLREYTSSSTWTKPIGLKELYVCVLGAGGGGGSGRKHAAGVQRCGGGGGGGGGLVLCKLFESELAESIAITVGAGGAGGASQTVDSTNGNAGVAGGATSFGGLLSAAGGLGGRGGDGNNESTFSAWITSPINGTACTPKISPIVIVAGHIGPASRDTTGYNACAFSMAGYGVAGGAGGASIGGSGGNIVFWGGMGSVVYDKDGNPSTATARGEDGASNIALQLFGSFGAGLPLPTKGVGASGGGGAASRTADGTKGGNGGLYGAGGGGGAAAENGYNSGAGGDGAQGLCLLIEVT